MRWQLKSLLQNAISLLPSDAGYEAYYRAQRRFGALRQNDPRVGIRRAAATVERLLTERGSLHGAHLLEVGTGRRLLAPMTYWLAGAERITTVDTNPYLKAELLREDLARIQADPDAVRELFPEGVLDETRFERLLGMAPSSAGEQLLELCAVDYLAPQDASALPLDADSVDFHISYSVLEHVPPDAIGRILAEGARVLRADGRFVHFVDFRDHFAYDDPRIGAMHFLRFEDWQWRLIAGNRYMYMNRLRVDDMEALFERAGLEVRSVQRVVDAPGLEAIASGRQSLAAPFAGRDAETLATGSAWFIVASR